MREGIHRNQSLHTATSTDIAADLSDQQHFHYQTHSIEMKKFLIKSSIAGLSLLAMGTTYAQQSGTVNFSGDINPVTCVVALASRNQTIDYGVVPPNATGFTGGGGAVGNVAQAAFSKPVVITLTGCSTPGSNNQPSSASVKFTGPINSAGRFSTTGNTSVDIELLEHGSSTPWDLRNNSAGVTLVAGTNTLSFLSRFYVATLPLGVGPATVNATFVMSYS